MKSKEKPIKFSLKQIRTQQFAIIEESYYDKEKSSLSSSFHFGADKGNKIIGVFVSCKFETKKQPFLIIEVRCFFQIEDKDWESLFNSKNNTVHIPKGFITHLAMLTVGTTRGVLHAKTENTPFNRFILPPLNITDYIKEDISL